METDRVRGERNALRGGGGNALLFKWTVMIEFRRQISARLIESGMQTKTTEEWRSVQLPPPLDPEQLGSELYSEEDAAYNVFALSSDF